MAAWKKPPGRGDSYGASAVENQNPLQNHKTAKGVTTLQSERGYSVTNYDASVVKRAKTLRRQIGQKYDAKKIRNTISCSSASRRCSNRSA